MVGVAQRTAANSSSTQSSHQDATLKRSKRPFGIIPEFQERLTQPTAKLSLIRQLNVQLWVDETSIKYFVSTILNDIARAMGLEGFHLDQEKGILGIRPGNVLLLLYLFHFRIISLHQLRSCGDIWVILALGRPVGVVALKSPAPPDSTENVLDSKNLAGQVYDRLKCLQSYRGFEHPFAIASTYQEWRICWLNTDAAKRAARETRLDFFTYNESSVRQQLPESPPCWDNSEEDEKDEEQLESATPTEIGDGQFPAFLCPAGAASIYEWQLGLPPTLKLQVNKLPGQNTTNFYLLQDLGAGADGRVWLAATAYGTACALKYAHAALAFTLFKEAELWNTIWKRKARCQKIGGQLALVMPYVKPCTKEEFTKREVVAAIKEAAERMMEAGYDHGDLKREHVGLYCDLKGGHKAVFFDLARAKPLKPHKSSLSAILQQLNIE
ncbi:hypothetical protein QOT17_023476 [Balamuthia mandrillaris]